MLNNIYAQLELRFGLLRSTTPEYTSYSYKALRSSEHDRSPTAEAIRKIQKKAKIWTHVDVDAAARSSGLPRSNIVSKLDIWHNDKLIDLKAAGVVNIYRVLKDLPNAGEEMQRIVDALYRELEIREQQELQRMDQVIGLITGTTCFARVLSNHFGDILPDQAQKCGHCTWCETNKAVEVVSPPRVEWNSRAFLNILNAIPDRDDPRFLARVAFGIISPRVQKSKGTVSKVLGSMEDHNFMVCTANSCPLLDG